MSSDFTRSIGSVFEDLGFPPEEAQNLRLRSVLMASIRSIIEKEQLTQARAAEIFGVTQPGSSDLVRGKIELFRIDSLVGRLASSGRHVEISIRLKGDQTAQDLRHPLGPPSLLRIAVRKSVAARTTVDVGGLRLRKTRGALSQHYPYRVKVASHPHFVLEFA